MQRLLFYFILYLLFIPRFVISIQSSTYKEDKKEILSTDTYTLKDGNKFGILFSEEHNNRERIYYLCDSQSRYVDSRKYDIEFSLDCFQIPAIAVQANADFTIGYILSINEVGSPRNVRFVTFDKATESVMKGVLDTDEVFSCMKGWKLKGLNQDSIYTILLRWEHMKGWVTMVIYSDKMNLYLNLQPDRK